MKIIISILLLICLSQCSDNPKPAGSKEIIIKEILNPVNVKFVLEKRILINDLLFPFLFAGEEELFLYGVSAKDSKTTLNIYDKAMNFLSPRSFFTGQGPGDLGAGAHFYKFDDQIYFADNTQQRVNIFDKDFNFKKFVMVGTGYVTLIRNGDYLLHAHMFQDEKKNLRVQKISLSTFPGLKEIKLKELEPYWPIDSRHRIIQFMENGFHYFCHQDVIYVLDQKSYNISTFNLSGAPLKSIKLDVKPKYLSDETREMWLRELRGREYDRIKEKVILTDYLQPAAFMIPMNKGFAVIRRESYVSPNCTEKPMVTADYFDYQLNLKGQIQLPCFWRIFELNYYPKTFQYKDGFLYLVSITEDEQYYFEKWRVIE